jgi:iron complex outermembrane receptor protein
MTTRAIFFIFMLLLLPTSYSFSSEKKPLRITIHPTMINKNVVGSSTTIIDYDTIKKSSYKTIGDLISKYSGVNFENYYYGTDAKTSVRIRGFGEQASRNILILVNGIRLTDMTIGGANLSRLNVDDIYEIEIIKGGSAGVLFGDGAVGGAINIITKDPLFMKDKLNFKSSFKSFNSKSNSFSITKRLDEFVIQSFISKEESKGYRENNKFENDTLNFNLSYLKDPINQYNVNLVYSEQFTGLPGNISLTDFYTTPRYSRTPEDFGTEKVNSISFGSQNTLNSGIKLSNIFKFEDKDQITSSLSSGQYILAKTNLETSTFSSKVIKNHKLDNINLNYNIGIDFFSSGYRAIGNNWSQVKYHNIANQKIFEPFGIFKFDHSQNKNFQYEVGLRYHHYELDADNYTTKSSLSSIERDNYAWSLGMNYDLEKNNNIFAHISRSYRSPRLDEIISLVSPTPALKDIKHQYSNDVELGYEFSEEKKSYKLSLFRTLIKNQIYLNQTTFNNENFDPSVQQGLEIEFNQSIFDNLNLKSNATYVDSHFTKGIEKGNETSYVPKLSGNASLNYNLDNYTYTSLEYKYMGKQRSGNDPTYILPKSKSYQIIDFNISHDIKNFKIKGSINNVFNKKYYTNLIKSASWSGNKPYVYPQPGRTLFFGVEATF